MRYTHADNVAAATARGLAATLGLAWIAARWLEADAWYVAQAAGAFLVMPAIPILAREPHPHSRFGLANLVTLVRAAGVALVAGLIGRPTTTPVIWAVIVLVTVIGALDGVDGHVARRTGIASPFGARFDVETDAFLILVLSVLVWQTGKAGSWIVLCGLMRYAFVGAGWLMPWLAQPLSPTRRGKTVAVMQFVGLAAALGPIVPLRASVPIAAMTLALLTWSFAIDVTRLRQGSGG